MRHHSLTLAMACFFLWLPYAAHAAPGEVDTFSKIASNTGGLGSLVDFGLFGTSCTTLGDLDGDGIPELVVGATGDNTGGSNRGALYILFLDRNGSVKSQTKIADNTGGFGTLADADKFGISCAALGDLDGDGVSELVVGASDDDTGGSNRGALYILFLDRNGSVKSQTKIANNTGEFGTLTNADFFGTSCTTPGDLDGDGIPDLVVGAEGDDTGGTFRGAVYVLFLNVDGSVKSQTKIADDTGGFGTLTDSDGFGISCSPLGDLNGDGIPELVVGATGDDTGGILRGAVYVLFLNADGSVKSQTKIASNTVGFGALANADFFGISCTFLGDLDGDGIPELAVGAEGDDTDGDSRGAIHILSLGDLPITVTTAADEFDTPSGANLSLREAIRDAEATGEFREIDFAPSLNGSTITLTDTLNIASGQSLRITAKDLPDGITISGDGQHQIIEHQGDALTLECLNLENGFEGGSGGGIEAFTSSALFVNQVTFRRCISTSSLARGGAISSSGFAKITNSTFIENEADEGGAISMTLGTAQLQAVNCTFISNSATTLSDPNDGGGAILCSGIDAASINFCTFIENSAVQGSALLTDNSTVTLRNCLFPGSMFVIDFVNGGIANEFESRFPDLDDLAPLANYNGKIPTRPLLPTATDINGVPFLPLPTTDQNGLPRTRNGGSDPGAAEAIELTDYQPDNLIGEKRGRQKGNNLYNTTGAGQKVKVKLQGRKKFKTFMTVQNDGIFPDSFIMRSNKPNKRTLKLKVRQLGGGNVTAALRRGLPLLNLAPGQSVAFKADYKRKSKDRKARGKLRFTSTSSFFGKSDTVQAKIKSLRERRR